MYIMFLFRSLTSCLTSDLEVRRYLLHPPVSVLVLYQTSDFCVIPIIIGQFSSALHTCHLRMQKRLTEDTWRTSTLVECHHCVKLDYICVRCYVLYFKCSLVELCVNELYSANIGQRSITISNMCSRSSPR